MANTQSEHMLPGSTLSGSVGTGSARQRGFSLFEMVVYILAASILFAAAFNRYQEFPGEAERANFLAILAQLNTAVNLQMVKTIASGEFNTVALAEGSNPMDLMLQPPGNYVGAFAGVNESELPRRIWYFDSARRELVYLANDSRNLFLVDGQQRISADRIRFRVSNVYGPGGAQGWQGIVLAPVQPYEWQAVQLQLHENQQ